MPAGTVPPANNLANRTGGWHVARMKRFTNFFAATVSIGAVFWHFQAAAAATNDTLAFGSPEIFPIDQGVAQMNVADLNGDGLNDIIIANNLRSKIDLLYNETGKTNRTDANPLREPELNDLPADARFHLDSIPADENISALAVKDLNGDGKPDLVYFGDQKDLVVLYNLGTNGWSEPKKWHFDDGQLDANALSVGDLNGNGLNDIVLLGDNGAVYFLAQKNDHTFDEPQKISYSGTPHAVQITDVNSDGRKDLLLVDFDSLTPYHVRFQSADGQLGPETYFKAKPIRSFAVDNLGGDATNYLTSIAQATGRAEVSQFTRQPAETLAGTSFKQGQFQILPLKHTDASQRGVLWADVNGDGRPDLLVAQPESGQLSIYLQSADGTLAPPKTFPSLAGVSQIIVADWNKNGHPEIFLLSKDENSVAMTQFDKNGHLPFPTPIPLGGKPLMMTAGALKTGAKPALAIIVDKDGARSLVTVTADGKTKTQKLNANFNSNPATFAVQDVNEDGLADLVILIPYEKVKVLLQKKDGTFDETDVDPPGGAMDQPWLAAADIDGDGKTELLLPQKNFLRAVVLEPAAAAAGSTNAPGWVFRVKDQINGAAGDSRITGATVVTDSKTGKPAIFLLDAGHKQLTLCQRDSNGVWQVIKNFDLPAANFAGLKTIQLNGSDDVAFLGQNAVAWQSLAGEVGELTKLDYYDTPIKDGYLNDMIAGDLTGGGRKQLVFMESAKNYLDIVFFNKERKLVPGNRWQVFEQHTFRSQENALPEPRETVISDVTGDKKNDLIVLVHDRILVYPQE